MNTEYIKNVLLGLQDVYEKNMAFLSELDAAIGDGDHGASMVRGFRAVKSAMEKTQADGVGPLLAEAGNVLMKEIGGTCGPLYAMFFITGAASVNGLKELDAQAYYALIKAGTESLMKLGKAQAGDKTMADALLPAVAALEKAAECGLPVMESAKKASAAADAGRDATADMAAKRGRGRYQGDSSKGHVDAGAASMALLLHAFAGEI